MTRKLTIPITPALRSRRVEDVRKRMGGRESTEAGGGEVVTVRREGAPELVGVVVFVRGDELDVMTDESTVRRTQRARVSPGAGKDASAEWTAALAADAKVFATLEEGQRVRYLGETGRLEEGMLVEKCRYGGIVMCADHSLMGVGFRKLWPASPGAAVS
jgi:hypothetical protein